jgi:hypothetical protein
MAAQGSCALMEDSRPYSRVSCHAHGAQILEFPSLTVPKCLCRALRDPNKNAELIFSSSATVHRTLNVDGNSPDSVLRQ